MGEMPAYYAAAHVALLGGSFLPLGGQNLIEAAACGCPVLMGPSTFNFADAAEWSLAAGAAERVADMAEAISRLPRYIDEGQYRNWAQICKNFAQTHRGAAAAMAQSILNVALPAHRAREIP
jgi:3-deoxy-D-manno-octulosonic-acid transferase